MEGGDYQWNYGNICSQVNPQVVNEITILSIIYQIAKIFLLKCATFGCSWTRGVYQGEI